MCMSAGLEVEGALVEQFLKVAGWSSHSWRVLGQRDWDVLAGCVV
jgi:hypothetical protein